MATLKYIRSIGFVRFFSLILFAAATLAVSSKRNTLYQSDCVKGKYVGIYCEGVVIKILDAHTIGKDWRGMGTGKVYSNSIVASIDSILLNSEDFRKSFFTKDSIFYFKYKEGGYPRKQFNICEPSSFVTILFTSTKPC